MPVCGEENCLVSFTGDGVKKGEGLVLARALERAINADVSASSESLRVALEEQKVVQQINEANQKR